MSATLADDGPGDRRPRVRRVTNWIGHRWAPLVVLFMATAAPFDLAPKHDWIVSAASKTHGLLFMAVVLLGVFHDVRLCEPCIAAMPLDGAAEAERRRWMLRVTHAGKGLASNIAYVGVLLLPLLAPHGPYRFAADIAILVPIAAYWVVQRTHRRLYPWCPWCTWGGGGDGIHEPSPDPSINTPSPQPA